MVFVDFEFSKCAIKSASAFGCLLKIRSSAIFLSFSLISEYGITSFGLIITVSRPYFTAWYKNTALSTLRALGESPKLRLLRPSVVNEFGNLFLINAIPSSVFFPASWNSASPVASVKVRASKMNWSSCKPYFFPVS